ncbi:alpha-amylase family glycosyl hydrolase [Urechidicola sp. P050]|uniref:Alpha-amylase family glycosyl hydrolase n=2 Tax=Urechidicola vernalis TaxID=3075600 RepID=A0ABU2Y322_9FLAO|nr:alpha-amylase family glycosyl hydrolase [Urechidicola sp. P050]MDT0552608.1 alpha-amylase family glycosyl hydrolase [Urechidicola sp. P050]
MFSCIEKQESNTDHSNKEERKKVVYQVFTRLFGNTNTTNKPWGTIEENGVGKFNDFTEKALKEIKDLGVTHIWYTGVPHHATITDYSDYGISNDDPDVVKGRAGSPYAVKDYYNVNPDLSENPEHRLEEFKALVKRTHEAGLKVIIDIVPNHVARKYEGKSSPKGIEPFGASDNSSLEYAKHNNFYYIQSKSFKVPVWENEYKPLGGDTHVLVDRKFEESPAKWTGNGSRLAQPSFYDWYETVKVNYGVKQDGTKDFEGLPLDSEKMKYQDFVKFWSDKDIPKSWIQFKDIAMFWLEMGVDGFRYDMAEMVPVEFWNYMNSTIKSKYSEAFLLAEVYNPSLYRDYIFKGKMDYLYDKVALYDTIKNIMQGRGSTDNLSKIQEDLNDIEHHMLHFLENHDEQRVASPEFAGNAEKGKPAMVVSATISTSPTLIYFGQEVGEPGVENAGFGSASRTSIFDYIGVPHHQRWMNDKKFDGGQSSSKEMELREFYKRLLSFTVTSEALMGGYKEIHHYNRKKTVGYNDQLFSFVRWSKNEKLIIISNFDDANMYDLEFKIPSSILQKWKLTDKEYQLLDQLNNQKPYSMFYKEQEGTIKLTLEPLQSLILKLN